MIANKRRIVGRTLTTMFIYNIVVFLYAAHVRLVSRGARARQLVRDKRILFLIFSENGFSILTVILFTNYYVLCFLESENNVEVIIFKLFKVIG